MQDADYKHVRRPRCVDHDVAADLNLAELDRAELSPQPPHGWIFDQANACLADSRDMVPRPLFSPTFHAVVGDILKRVLRFWRKDEARHPRLARPRRLALAPSMILSTSNSATYPASASRNEWAKYSSSMFSRRRFMSSRIKWRTYSLAE